MKAIVFASRRDTPSCKEALGRLGCDDIRVITNPNDIGTTDSNVSIAVVEIFNVRRVHIGYVHSADDNSKGIQILRALRKHCPNCAVLALSHSLCLNSCNYVHSQKLADHVKEFTWVSASQKKALDMTSIIVRELEQAQEVHAALALVREAS